MKGFFVLLGLVMTISLLMTSVSATSGATWTTSGTCGDPQNVNEYAVGEVVYINGANFAPGEYDWEIIGQPGESSCDPQAVVAQGSYTVDESGAFCFEAYTVQEGDCGVYKSKFSNKQDNYHVIPEFGAVVGIMTVMGAIGLFFLIRRN